MVKNEFRAIDVKARKINTIVVVVQLNLHVPQLGTAYLYGDQHAVSYILHMHIIGAQSEKHVLIFRSWCSMSSCIHSNNLSVKEIKI